MAIIGHMIGKEVLEALGLTGQRVCAVDIRIATDEVVTVKVERYVKDEEAKRFVSVFQTYELVERQKVEDTTNLESEVRERQA